MGTASYSHLREHLADVWDSVEDTQEPVIVSRRGHQDMAMLPADELASLQETAHLMRSPKNARRLLEAIARANNGEGEVVDPRVLRDTLGLTD
ncbi:MAG: type II toxin-antitoxin system prevent-host-death family antitoxin [Gemmatimonadaceae bacterium]